MFDKIIGFYVKCCVYIQLFEVYSSDSKSTYHNIYVSIHVFKQWFIGLVTIRTISRKII